MRAHGEYRTRTALWFDGPLKILVDCGPDITGQLADNALDCPEMILLTHEHGDHYLGLDDLEVFRRRKPAGSFMPIPAYASAETWQTIEKRFGYLLGKLIEKRTAVPGRALAAPSSSGLTITPFKTDHGPMPRGSIGYVIEYGSDRKTRKLVYTSDFRDVPDHLSLLEEPDVLVAQAHWFNEPTVNRPSHMSFQRLLAFLERWRPREHVYLVHLSDGDLIPGESAAAYLKKSPPRNPMRHPVTHVLFPVPRCHSEWQARVNEAARAHNINVPITVGYDGLTVAV